MAISEAEFVDGHGKASDNVRAQKQDEAVWFVFGRKSSYLWWGRGSGGYARFRIAVGRDVGEY